MQIFRFKNYVKLGFLCFLMTCLSACNTQRVVNHFEPIPNTFWEYNKPIQFDVKMEDTTQLYEVKLNVRYTSSYLYPYLGMIVATESPDGRVEKREVTFYLQDEKGDFKGDVAGDIWDYCCFTLIEPQRFQQGNYHFSLYQVTAMPAIRGVMGLGLEVIKQEENE